MAFNLKPTERYNDFSLEPLNTPHRRRVESTFLVELRRHPRFDTRFPATVLTASGESVDVQVTNISLSGMRLEGDRHMIESLLPGLERLDRHTPVSLQVSFVKPGPAGQPVGVRTRCQTVYARAEGEHRYQIGVMITAFDTGRDAYAEYILKRQAEN